ncbi:triadin-like [Oryx dammah]|uniref:triadin-like n=1 Tax=Oryx dammah TaxID=59534 RepID=UPI001A9B5DCA|nr:triadin-like [Oryx dammah]
MNLCSSALVYFFQILKFLSFVFPSESQVKKEAKPASSEKAQILKQDTVKPEKTISHGKPVLHFTESGDDKVVKHVKATTIEKTVKPKPTKKAEHQGKESPSIKTDKPKPTPSKCTILKF